MELDGLVIFLVCDLRDVDELPFWGGIDSEIYG